MTIDSSMNWFFVADENNSGDNSVLENSERMYPFKKRKFFYQTSSSTSDSWSHCQGTVDSSYTRVNGTTNHGAGATMHGCFLSFFLFYW
jgi:hypothetical protein